MKSPGVIYRRYRQLKRKILYEKLQEARKKLSKNCFYSKHIEILDKNIMIPVCICAYNIDINKNIDICNNPEDCNAFVNKFSRKYVEDDFNSELKNSLIRNKKYPELNCLEWILDKTLEDAKKEPSIFVKFIVLLIIFFEKLIKITAKNQKRLMDDR
jgi:hypothetical protein